MGNVDVFGVPTTQFRAISIADIDNETLTLAPTPSPTKVASSTPPPTIRQTPSPTPAPVSGATPPPTIRQTPPPTPAPVSRQRLFAILAGGPHSSECSGVDVAGRHGYLGTGSQCLQCGIPMVATICFGRLLFCHQWKCLDGSNRLAFQHSRLWMVWHQQLSIQSCKGALYYGKQFGGEDSYRDWGTFYDHLNKLF